MHELTATKSILDMVVEEAARVGARRITKICLKSGEWSTFDPDSIAFYFGIVSRGTAAEGARLDVQILPVRYLCAECQIEYEPLGGQIACPQCQSGKGKLVGGREFYVDSIEVEHADTVGASST